MSKRLPAKQQYQPSESMSTALELLRAGKVRELDQVLDLAAEISGAVMRREITTSASRELRQWAELMYTCIQAENVVQGGDTNFVTQLIQIAGGPTADRTSQIIQDVEAEPKQIISIPKKATG